MSERDSGAEGMSVKTATYVEYGIIGLGILALVLIFQPFSLALFSVGCALVVLATLLAILSAHLYGVFFVGP
jgi:hypothetical protein